jgi:tubulin epsilon
MLINLTALIDMECGPLNETMKSSLGSLFDHTQYVMDVYGSGNNFAHGFGEYGPKYRPSFEDALRRIAEQCDSLQSFVLLHSLGGGTGSGVGSYVLGMLDDMYPTAARFTASVFPSEDDDVVTSPYNSILAAKQIIDHADCSFPLDNHALQALAQSEQDSQSKGRAVGRGETKDSAQTGAKSRSKGFDSLNNCAATMLCHLTASARHPGQLNVDLNEIATNLVPFPRMPFLLTALSNSRSTSIASKTRPSDASRLILNRAINDVLGPSGQLSAACPTSPHCITLASAFLSRGSVQLSDLISGVTLAQSQLTFPAWNERACKIGLCSVPSPGRDASVLAVYNRCHAK